MYEACGSKLFEWYEINKQKLLKLLVECACPIIKKLLTDLEDDNLEEYDILPLMLLP